MALISLTDLPENLDTDATDDFSGSYGDLTDVPADIADGDQVDDADADPENEIQDLQINDDILTITGKAMATEIDLSGYTNTDEQNLSFDGNQITLSGDPDQTVIDLSNYDQDASDDFDGSYNSLTDLPENLDTDATDDFSGSYGDLTDVPAYIADGDQVDDADADPENEIQDLQINDDILTITGKAMATEIDLSGYTNTDEQDLSFDGNQITLSGDPDQTVIDLSNYDQDASDDFDGSYNSLTDLPENLDTDATDDFSGSYNDLTDLPENLDTDATDDFSGSYGDLTDVPAYIADGDQVDDADADPENEIQDLQINDDILTITGKAMATEIDLSGYTNTDEQDLSFDGNQITLSGDPDQTVIDLSNYDQDASDDFDGSYNSLTDLPENLDTDATDDFSGSYNDLTDLPENLDTDATDDFSGSYGDLTDVPADIVDGDQVDDADADPENEIQDLQISNDVLTITGKAMATEIDLSGYTNTDEQDLSFDGNQITLSGDPDQTVIDLSNYDQDASDDFDGSYNSLTDLPENLDTDATDDFSGSYNDLTDLPENLDIDATDDFSGSYSDLTDVPADLADGDQVDDADADPENEIQDLQISNDVLTITGKAMATEIDLSGYTNTDEQDLSFDGNQITLSGDPDNTVIDLSNYDQDASDDFDGSYNSLTDLPANLDTDATDDFNGSYTDLTDVPAEIADGDQVDDADADPENEIQDLQINDDILTITGKAMATEIDLSGYTNTDEQNLSFDGNHITLSGDPDQTVIDLSNYDQDASDDFSGSYNDLEDKPVIISSLSAHSAIELNDINDSGSGFIITQSERTDFTSASNEVQSNALNWNEAYNTISSNAYNWNETYNTVSSNSYNWDEAYNTVSSNSYNWDDAYNTVSSNGSNWDEAYNTMSSSASNWDDTYYTVSSNSSNWDEAYSILSSKQNDWDDAYSTVSSNSYNWDDAYNAVSSNASNWDEAYNTITSNSFNWDETYNTVSTNANNWDDASSLVMDNFYNWNETYNTINQKASNWDDTYNTVFSNYSNWDMAFSWGDHQSVGYVVPADLVNYDTDATDDFSGSYNDLTDLPANLDTDATDDFSGDYTDLTGGPWTINQNNISSSFSGNMGLGINPSANLHISKPDASIQLDDSDGTASTSIVSANNYARIISDQSIALFLDSDNNENGAEFRIEKNANSFSGQNANLFTVKESGNVGVGTNDPQYTLDVAGSFRTQSMTVGQMSTDQSLVVGRGVENASISMGNGNGTEKWKIETETAGQYGYNGNLIFKSKYGALYDDGVTEVARISHQGLWGIWNNNPQHELDISSVGGTASLRIKDGFNGGPLTLSSEGSGESWIRFGTEGSYISRANGQFNIRAINLGMNLSATESPTNQMYLSPSGDVGMGTSLLSGRLTIEGGKSGEYNGLAIGNTDASVGNKTNILFYQDALSQALAKISTSIVSDSPFRSDIRFSTINNGDWVNDAVVISPEGNLGVGTNDPDAKLDVSGNIRSTHIQLTDQAGEGKVLTSDASGNATWQDPNSLITETGWEAIGNTTSTSGDANVTGTVIANGLRLTSAPASGKVLTSDAIGNATWQDPNALIIDNGWSGVTNGSTTNANNVEIGGSLSLARYQSNATLALGNGNGTPKWQIETEATGPYNYNGNLIFKSKMGEVWDAPLQEAMRLTRWGNLGLGTNNPLYKMTMEASGAGEVNILGIGNTSGVVGSEANILFYQNQQTQALAKMGAYITDATPNLMSSDLRFSTINGGYWKEDAMVIKGDGKVGIGTTTPSGALHVKANIADNTPGSPSVDSHVMVIENTSTLNNSISVPNPANWDLNNVQVVNSNSNNGLAINLNVPQYHLDTKNHFISFYRDENNLAGRIEGEHTADFLQFRQLVEGTISTIAASGGGAALFELNATFNDDFLDWNDGNINDYNFNQGGFQSGFFAQNGIGLSGGGLTYNHLGVPTGISLPSITGSLPSVDVNKFTLPTLSIGSSFLPSMGTPDSPITFGDPFITISSTLQTDLINAFNGFASTYSGLGASLLDAHDNFSEFTKTRFALEQSVVLANTLTTGGVTYQSGSGDYAEWLEMEDKEEEFRPGDVVGVHGGMISKRTKGADHVMIISVDPIVLGNAPEAGREEDFKKVAFMGQVPVRTFGEVREGDFLVASGFNNGEAIGLAPEELEIRHLSDIVGIAWSDSYQDFGVSYVKASVGLRTQDMAVILQKMTQNMADLMKRNEELASTTADLKNQYAAMAEQIKVINSLLVPKTEKLAGE